VGLLALLVVEMLALSLRFDAASLADQQGWMAALLARSGLLISLGIFSICLMGAILYGSPLDEGGPGGLGTPSDRGGPRWPYLVGHLATYGLLAWLSGRMFRGGARSSSAAFSWEPLWIAAGIATLGLWMLAALPLSDWKRLAQARWKALLFAGLTGVAALVLGQWTTLLWGVFHESTFRTVRGVLGLFYDDIVCRPADFVLGTPRFRIRIAYECSGFQGIGLIWTFLACYLWWFRHELRFPQALLLLPLGTALSWTFNVVRIASLIALGDHGWRSIAFGGFHSKAGWLAFNGIALGLILLSRRIALFRKAAATPVDEPIRATDPTAAYIAPLVTIAFVSMITGMISDGGLDRLYALRVLVALAVLWHFRREYGGLRGACSWHAVAVGLAVYAIWTALAPAPESAATELADPLAKLPRPWLIAWLAARSVGSVIVVPVAEELAFRGYLTRRLIAADFQAVPEGRFTWLSFLASSLLFGLLHQQRMLAGTIAGMAYALAYYRRGRLIDAVAAHSLTNLLITISALWTGEWSRWS
jgi:exosortase E/protease (VPEID-CTERM system)